LHALLRAKGAVPEYLIDTIMSGLAALRDFDPVFVGLGVNNLHYRIATLAAGSPQGADIPISVMFSIDNRHSRYKFPGCHAALF
jgi:hypothetical protein